MLFENRSINTGPAVSGDAVPVRRDTAPSGQTAGNCSLERENSSQGPRVGNVDVARTTVNNSHVS